MRRACFALGLAALLVGCGHLQLPGDRRAATEASRTWGEIDLCASVPSSVLGPGGFDTAGRRESTSAFDSCTWRAGDRQLTERVQAGTGGALEGSHGMAIAVEGAVAASRYEVLATDGEGWRLELEAFAAGRSVVVELLAPLPDLEADGLAVAVAEAVIASLR